MYINLGCLVTYSGPVITDMSSIDTSIWAGYFYFWAQFGRQMPVGDLAPGHVCRRGKIRQKIELAHQGALEFIVMSKDDMLNANHVL